MNNLTTLTFERVVQVVPEAVYHAFTNRLGLQSWLCDSAQADTKVGGRVYLYWNMGYYAAGFFTSLKENEEVAFTWQGTGESMTTTITAKLTPAGNHTHIHLTHADIEADSNFAKTSQQEWPNSLNRLAELLETGLDPRFYNRPMLGIVAGAEVTADMAEKHSLPVATGVRLDGFVDGMGAKEAGLEEGDILTQLGETAITNFRSLGTAVQPYKAGDTVPIIYYRGQSDHTSNLTLSGRPRPAIPASASQLADAVRTINTHVNTELAELFEGVSEEAAGQRPEPNAWSAKEVVAHLIATEQASHLHATTATIGDTPNAWASNEHIWVRAITAAYPTVPELLETFAHSGRVTTTLIRHLPNNFINQKSRYIPLGDLYLNNLPLHTRSHFAQIKTALNGVKN